MDWGKGEYERTARELEPAAAAAIEALRPRSGDLILDVACGTGNAALLAAKAGARTIGVDASARLLDVAARRGRMEAVDVVWQVADLQHLPYEDDSFDRVISVFGVIFAEDAQKAAAELRRVTRPGGTIVITAWLPTGPVVDCMKVMSATAAEFSPSAGDPAARLNWSDANILRELLGPQTEVTEHQLAFKGTSPAAWVLQQSEFHPLWLDVRDLMPRERYEGVLDEMTKIVSAANVNPDALKLIADYVIARVKVDS